MDVPLTEAQPTHRWRNVLAVMCQWLETPQQQTVAYEWFSEREVAGYHRAQIRSNVALEASEVDDATWRDLDVRSYLQNLGTSASIFARQMLYHRLRSGADNTAFAAPLMDAVSGAVSDDHADTAQLLTATQVTRHGLRCIDVDITPTLFHGERIALPDWTRFISAAAWAGLGSLLLAASSMTGLSALGLWLVGAYLVFNAWTQIKLYRSLVRWNTQRDGVLAMLQAAKALAQTGQTTHHAALRPLTEHLPEIERLLCTLSPSWIDRTPMLAEYANLFALYQYAQLAVRTKGLDVELSALQTVYRQLATCEAQLCLLEHVLTQSVLCRAQHITTTQDALPGLQVRGMVNPLLDRPQALTLNLQGKGAFISGQNGVGKSTLLRGLGLNLLAARAFGFCYAASATVPRLAVWSSIQNEDSLATADSLYMAEMRRAETLLRVAENPQGAVFLIDEIFRGTNNAESVSAAAAVLSHLAARALVVVSSHNVVLAPLLQPWLVPFRLVQDATGAGLTLEPGVLAHTNGLQMMQNYRFPADVHTTASHVHDWFANYVAQPDHFPDLAAVAPQTGSRPLTPSSSPS